MQKANNTNNRKKETHVHDETNTCASVFLHQMQTNCC